MIVTIISKKHINTISLPEKIKGQFWLYETTDLVEERLINIEGINDEWIMKSTRQVKIIDTNNSVLRNTIIARLR